MKRTTKTYLKAGIRSIFFIGILSLYSLYNLLIPSASSLFDQHQEEEEYHHRRLVEEEDLSSCEDDLRKADPAWLCILYFLGILYMFIAIAIVCDELFVPTLEELASDRHLNLSMDVAGATLMAAGGSAPELFTSIFGTFVQESEVGIGTVVGSAVFNVLFVIAMCAIFSKEVLELTWWPLFRDSTYYSIGLILLGLFVGVISPSEIELWESIVLFGMYIGYVVMMAFNRQIYKLIAGKEFDLHPEEGEASGSAKQEDVTTTPNTDDEEDEEAPQEKTVGPAPLEEQEVVSPPTGKNDEERLEDVPLDVSQGIREDTSEEKHEEDGTTSTHHEDDDADEESPPKVAFQEDSNRRPLPSVEKLAAIRSLSGRSLVSACSSTTMKKSGLWPGTFRSGILKLLRDRESWTDTAGVGIVSIIAGDVHHVFRVVDVDGNGEIDKDELRQLFAKIDCSIPQEELDNVMKELDANNDGKITEEDFMVWYLKSESRISARVGPIFKIFDTDESGTIDRSKIRELLETLEPGVADDDIEEAMNAMYQHGSRDEISFDEFEDWYIHSIVYQRQLKRIEDDMNGILDSIKPPSKGSGCITWAKYILLLPIIAVLGLTVPDVRRPGCQKFCYVTFVLSIMWIGFFSYFMVDWAEIIGHTIGIPSVIMGLTLLAAGTSVPDLLTSVIVARMGEGDMALSSSIGSNIFDILVGLPLPWICYTAWNKSAITVRRIKKFDLVVFKQYCISPFLLN